MAWLGNYGALLRTRGAPRLVAGHLAARLPTGLASVALLYTASASHLSSPGLAIAAYAVSVAATTVVTSRLTDRRGLRMVLAASAAGTFAGSVALVWRPDAGVFLGGAMLLGTAFTPVGNGLRLSLLAPSLSEPSRVAGNAYETIVMEVGALAGPTVAGVLIAAGAIDAAFWAIGVGALVGVSVMLTSPLLRSFDAKARVRDRGRYLDIYRGGTWVVPVVATVVTTGLSASEVGLFVVGSARWDAPTAGLLIALTSAGSLAGGLVFGARATRQRYTVLATAFCLLTAVGLAGLGLALRSGSLAVSVGAALVAQVGVAPLVVVLARLLPALAPPARVGEAYGLLSLGAFSGAVLGGLASTVVVGLAVFVPAVAVTALATAGCARLGALAPRVAQLSAQAAVPAIIDLTDRTRAAQPPSARARPVRFARFGWFGDEQDEPAPQAVAAPAVAGGPVRPSGPEVPAAPEAPEPVTRSA